MKLIKSLMYALLIVNTMKTNAEHAFPSKTINGFAVLELQSFTCLTINGSAALDDVTILKKLSVNGSASLEKVKVGQIIKIHGSLSAEDCKFHSVIVHGGVTLENTTAHDLEVHGGLSCENVNITSDAIIFGGASFEKSHLQNVEITAKNAHFSDSRVQTITLKKNNCSGFWSCCVALFNSYKEQTIELHDTIVKGDVIFEDAPGVVILKGNSKIHGNVINGTLANK